MMTPRRIAGLALATVLIFSGIVAWRNNPRAWRKAFHEKVQKAVPLGSTKADFDRAAEDGKLEIIVMDINREKIVYVLWEPVHFGEVDFCVLVEPVLDNQNLITSYKVTSCAHFFSSKPILHFPRASATPRPWRSLPCVEAALCEAGPPPTFPSNLPL
jgi:hypothetical protein